MPIIVTIYVSGRVVARETVPASEARRTADRLIAKHGGTAIFLSTEDDLC